MSNDEIKRMPVKEFIDSGLLFAVNHKVLHPLGLALEVVIDGDDYRFGGVWDYRDDPEGMLYHENLLQSGAAKLKQYMDERGDKDIADRVAVLGYVVQPCDNEECCHDGPPVCELCPYVSESGDCSDYSTNKGK